MKRQRVGIALCALAIAMPALALAHHSFAMFDREKDMTLQGVVKEFQWTNPHTWVQLMVTGTDGKVTEWSIEGTSPNGLKRQGWKSDALKSGDKVTVVIHPLRSGEPGGSLVTVTMSDGTVLGRRTAPPPPAE